MDNIRIHLVDINKEVCEAFHTHFGHYSNVSIWNCPFQQLPEFDLMVSPANSFGQMDGGIDKYITEFFGKQLMQRVQEYILEEYAGEQPVGTSFIIETNNDTHPYLAHTPTMRVPQRITGTDNAYRAMKAMLLAVNKHNEKNERKITSIACSGLGTFIGKMPPDIAVKQMALAYEHVKNPLTGMDWLRAWERHLSIEASKE